MSGAKPLYAGYDLKNAGLYGVNRRLTVQQLEELPDGAIVLGIAQLMGPTPYQKQRDGSWAEFDVEGLGDYRPAGHLLSPSTQLHEAFSRWDGHLYLIYLEGLEQTDGPRDSTGDRPGPGQSVQLPGR